MWNNLISHLGYIKKEQSKNVYRERFKNVPGD